MEYSTITLTAILLLAMIYCGESAPSSRRSRATKLAEETPAPSSRQSKLTTAFKIEASTTPAPKPRTNRKNKALNFFGFFPSFLSSGLDYSEDEDDDVTFSVNDDNIDDDDLSRTIPSRRRQQTKKKNGNGNGNGSGNNGNGNNGNYGNNLNSLQYDNSPIFYIRLPPTPYMFVPGLGYVSQPPNLGPPMGPISSVPQDPFINIPLDYVSNAKPTGVFQWNSPPAPAYPQMPVDPYGYNPQPIMSRPTYNPPSYSQPKPKPTPSNSKVTNLKGPYVFNGKPNDNVFVLRDTYNSIYSDALQNFYP